MSVPVDVLELIFNTSRFCRECQSPMQDDRKGQSCGSCASKYYRTYRDLHYWGPRTRGSFFTSALRSSWLTGK